MRWTDRIPCGSLRDHEAHQWTGQAYGETLRCPGASGGRYASSGVDPERSRAADRRLAEETNGITDSWRES